MGWGNVSIFPLLIVQSGQPNTGFFVYSVPPPLGAGNPPVLAIVAPGVTADPFGNPVNAVLNIGNFSAAHSGFDQNGIEYLSDTSGTVKIVIDPARGMFFYSGTAVLGNPPQLALALPGVTADTFGNAIGTSKILIQANVITMSGGIIRTAATAPLIQLDGPHNAALFYDTGTHLAESVAPAATSDGLGNTVQAGFTAYGSVGTTFAQLSAGVLDFGLSGNTANPQVAGAANASLSLNSGQTAALTTEIILSLQSSAGSFGTAVFTGNVDASAVGAGFQVKEGTNAKQGIAVLVAGTVTVANTSVTANSRIFLTCQVPGGAPGFLRISARTAGTSFTILSSSATDTSTVAFEIFEPG